MHITLFLHTPAYHIVSTHTCLSHPCTEAYVHYDFLLTPVSLSILLSL